MLALVGVILLGLGTYFALQWQVQDPLKFRVLSVTPEPKSFSRLIRYELRNDSAFPVIVEEFRGVCNGGDLAFPLDHRRPGRHVEMKAGASVTGELRCHPGIAVPVEYDTFVYRWEPAMQAVLRPFARRWRDAIRDDMARLRSPLNRAIYPRTGRARVAGVDLNRERGVPDPW